MFFEDADLPRVSRYPTRFAGSAAICWSAYLHQTSKPGDL